MGTFASSQGLAASRAYVQPPVTPLPEPPKPSAPFTPPAHPRRLLTVEALISTQENAATPESGAERSGALLHASLDRSGPRVVTASLPARCAPLVLRGIARA